MDDLTCNHGELTELLHTLKLTAFANDWLSVVESFEKNKRSAQDILVELVKRELAIRRQRRIERLLKQAKLPRLKTLKEFELQGIKFKVKKEELFKEAFTAEIILEGPLFNGSKNSMNKFRVDAGKRLGTFNDPQWNLIKSEYPETKNVFLVKTMHEEEILSEIAEMDINPLVISNGIHLVLLPVVFFFRPCGGYIQPFLSSRGRTLSHGYFFQNRKIKSCRLCLWA